MELIQGEDGKWHEGFPMTIFFESELKLNAFSAWMKEHGAKMFCEWYSGIEKLKDTECRYCKWCDPTQAQCFNGHIQGGVACDSYERKT